MHWLAGEVRSLREAVEAYEDLRDEAGFDPDRLEAEQAARATLHRGLRELLAALIDRDVVDACFIGHDGLVVDARGNQAYVEALAAMGQSFLVPARRAAQLLNLGPMQQVLLAGGEKKLVLIQIGPFTLGLLAPSRARLGSALANATR